jgi:hypothetical protein
VLVPPTPSPGTDASAFCSSSPSHAPLEAAKARFTSRRPTAAAALPTTTTPTPALTPGESISSIASTPSSQCHYLSSSPTLTLKRPASAADHTPPAKRPRQTPTSPIVIPSTAHPSTGSSSSQEAVDEPETAPGGNKTPTASFMRHIAPAPHPITHAPVLDTITASVSESSNRPSRSRHPPKNKYLEEVSKV